MYITASKMQFELWNEYENIKIIWQNKTKNREVQNISRNNKKGGNLTKARQTESVK